MEDIYLRNAKIMSALSTPMRLQILDMLSCGELCASQIQDAFSSLNQDRLQTFFQEVQQMASDSKSCVCHSISMKPCKEE